jgi:hypothetical protein
MCGKRVEIDGKIEHYRLLASRLTDQPTIDGIKELIERMQAQKLALHPSTGSNGVGDLPSMYPESSRRGHTQPSLNVRHVAQRDQSDAVCDQDRRP